MSNLVLTLNTNTGDGGAPDLSFAFTKGGGPFRLSSVQWPSWFLYMQDTPDRNVRGLNGDIVDDMVSTQGDLIFTPIDEGNYFLISTARWKDWYLYMQDNGEGNVRGYQNDPGPQGHWKITPKFDGSFLLSTKTWPSWYMYMQDVATGNIVGCNGDIGTQAHFKLSCDLLMKNQ